MAFCQGYNCLHKGRNLKNNPRPQHVMCSKCKTPSDYILPVLNIPPLLSAFRRWPWVSEANCGVRGRFHENSFIHSELEWMRDPVMWQRMRDRAKTGGEKEALETSVAVWELVWDTTMNHLFHALGMKQDQSTTHLLATTKSRQRKTHKSCGYEAKSAWGEWHRHHCVHGEWWNSGIQLSCWA